MEEDSDCEEEEAIATKPRQLYLPIDDLISLEKCNINIISQNVRSLNKNHENLKLTLDKTENLDIVLIQELWKPKIKLQFDGFSRFFCSRSKKNGGGLGILIKN